MTPATTSADSNGSSMTDTGATPGDLALAEPETSEDGRPARGHLPGDIHIWVFVLGDLIIFGVYFVLFMIARHEHRGPFLAAQQHLNLDIGAANTLVLLASSGLVAQTVVAARRGRDRQALWLTIAGIACGAVFTALKAAEWTAKIRHGMTFASNDFFMYYYLLTGIHLFHVLLGMVILGIVAVAVRDSGGRRRIGLVETAATYWHMVDLLWIAIFALVYLMR